MLSLVTCRCEAGGLWFLCSDERDKDAKWLEYSAVDSTCATSYELQATSYKLQVTSDK